MAKQDTPTRGIHSIYRVLNQRGKESLHILQSTGRQVLPYKPEIIEKVKEHFTEETVFYIKDEKRGRLYRCPKDWWLTMTAKQLIKSCQYGKVMDA